MATFSVTVHEAEILPHPNADLLSICKIAGYLSVVGKGYLKTGDLVAYIPEQAVVPVELQRQLNVEGKLSGAGKNRVKASRLRGVLSQGLVCPAKPHWKLGDDVTEELGITKYEPPIPESLRGDMFNAGLDFAFKFDIENIKKFNDVFKEGEEVVMTEKIHGTNVRITVVPETITHPECGRLWVASKGLGALGLCFKDLDTSPNNVYMNTAKKHFTPEVISKINISEPVSFFGEIFGGGIQDLHYGSDKADFRVFDIYIGKPNDGFFVGFDEVKIMCDILGLQMVPVLYQGPFSKDVLAEHTNGKETLSGDAKHVREGVVVKPVVERLLDILPMSRVHLKSVSEHYLLRKGNVTEYA